MQRGQRPQMSKTKLSIEHSAEDTFEKIVAQEARLERAGERVYAGDYDYLFANRAKRLASKKRQ